MIRVIDPVFVEFVPEQLEEGKLYVSDTYATASHKCCCGCGQRVVTPLNRKGWRLTVRDGAVTLYPSIGNWSFPCRSHYWIKHNRVILSYPMTQEEVEELRRLDAVDAEKYLDTFESTSTFDSAEAEKPTAEPGPASIFERLKRWWLG